MFGRGRLTKSKGSQDSHCEKVRKVVAPADRPPDVSQILEGNSNNYNTDKEISFLDKSYKCCVFFVDMVKSTETAATIEGDHQNVGKYYSVFLNVLANTARSFDAKVIKNAGDSIICYFPKTFDSSDSSAFKQVIDCGLAILSARRFINAELYRDKLPAQGYRISADYGAVAFASTKYSINYDLFGSTVNLCAKINSRAPPNGMVIGGDLYRVIKSFHDHSIDSGYYDFNEIEGYQLRLNQTNSVYPIYLVEPVGDSSSASLLSAQIESNEKIMNGDVIGGGSNVKANVIMIVDDEPDVLLTFKSYLLDSGYANIETFSDPQEALSHFAADPNRFGLIVLDIRMPKINGLQLYQRFIEINSDTKIIFVSALDVGAEVSSILPGVKPGNMLKKPVRSERFISEVRCSLAGFEYSDDP